MSIKRKQGSGSGGRRPGTGRKPTPGLREGWLHTSVELLRSYAEKTGKPQNQLINDLVKAYFTSHNFAVLSKGEINDIIRTVYCSR
jgi:hypothetical protein